MEVEFRDVPVGTSFFSNGNWHRKVNTRYGKRFFDGNIERFSKSQLVVICP